MKYKIIKSKRRSVGIQVTDDGDIVVRAPLKLSNKDIERIVNEKKSWIEKTLKRISERKSAEKDVVPLTIDELNELAKKALNVIPVRVKYFAELMGVTYGKITIRNQRSRWGSCSRAGNLNFNCLLMLTPPEVIDSVVVHELAHRREMNHSSKFYEEILKVFPEYHIWDKWLKKNGSGIIKRMTAMNL